MPSGTPVGAATVEGRRCLTVDQRTAGIRPGTPARSGKVSLGGVGSVAVASVVLLLAYKCALDLSYATVIRGHEYYALGPADVDWGALLQSYLAMGATLPFVARAQRRTSELFLTVTYVTSFVPMLTIVGFRHGDLRLAWAVAAFWIVVFVGVRAVPTPEPRWLRRPRSKWPALTVYGAMLVAAAAVLLQNSASLATNLMSSRFDLSNFYASRSRFVASEPPLHGYYFHWLALVLNPLFLVLAALKRHAVLVLVVAATEVPIAAFVGQRGYVFSLAVAVGAAWAAARRAPVAWIAGGVAAIVMVSTAVAVFTGATVPYFFFTGRLLLDAGQLTFYYYDFFTSHPVVPLGYFVHYYLYLPYPWPYGESPDYVIGRAYFGQHLAAVGGLVADALMNFGLWGLGIWAVLLILIGKAVDVVSNGVNRVVAMAALAVPAVSLANTYTVRVIFTTGLLWSLVMLQLLWRERDGQVVGASDGVRPAGATRQETTVIGAA